MITPAEIKQNCLKRWKDVLLQALSEGLNDETKMQQNPFPMEIFRIGKVKTKDILTNLLIYKEGISQLQNNPNRRKERDIVLFGKNEYLTKLARTLFLIKFTLNHWKITCS
jgi:hypothetical protein